VKDSKAALRDWIRALDAIRVLDERPGVTLAALVGEVARAHAASPALIGARETLTYGALAARVNQYGRWAAGEGFAAGDVVCLLMPNCADYAATWLGLTRIGCVVALLNTNLTGGALAHCIGAAKPRGIIVAAALWPTLVDAAVAGLKIWVHGDAGAAELPRIDVAIARLDDAPVGDGAREASETALLIYTSGTTGLPKAAKVTQRQVVEWSFWFAGMMDARPEDRLYNCLPMYHSIGGVVAVGAMLVRGGSVLIREKFSASQFWDDIVDGGCTIFQYIGELCRYLLQSPAHARETAHRLRLCCGNGLQGGTWEKFAARFEIPRILEYYAATEGVVSLYNCEGKPGAIGRVPAFLNHRFPIALVRCDMETGEPLRDARGFCIRCGPDEASEAIGKLGPRPRFYTDEAASERKILRDVFAAGDSWFRTGDLMRKDAAGFYYFVDRMGETFRWKGENVATTEVAAVVSACPGVIQAVVFGVAVPGQEGKAGMAAITTAADFDIEILLGHLARHLASYARPVFLRFCQTLESTGTFKLQKSNLQREGFAADDVWFCDVRTGQAVPCDEALIADIAAGRKRV
jgi:fatty-acyl-CoA synthase